MFKKIAIYSACVLVFCVGAAMADFAAPETITTANLVGTATSGSESGIFLFKAMVQSVLQAMLAITMLIAGAMIGIKYIRRFAKKV